MRTLRALVFLPPLVAMACFSSSGGNSPTVTFDASTLDGQAFDATEPDSMATAVDSSPPPADAGGNVLVTVVTPTGIPEPGATLVIGDPSGAVVGMATTGPGGTASVDVPTGGQVTAVLGPTGNRQFVTIQQLAAGDVLTVRDRTVSGTIDVSVTAIPTPPSGTATLYGDCVSTIATTVCPGGQSSLGTLPATIPVAAANRCYSGGQLGVLALAYSPVDGSTSTLLGYSYQKNIPVDLEAGTATASSFGPWIAGAGGHLTIDLVNAYGIGTTFPADAATPLMQTLFTEVTNGQPSDEYGYYYVPDQVPLVDGGTALSPWGFYPGFGDFEQPELEMFVAADNGVSITATATSAPTPTQGDLTVTMDFSTLLPPIQYAPLDVTNPQQPSVTIQQTGSLAATDGTLVSITWMENTDGGSGSTATWLVVAPPDVTTVTTPALPSSVGPWLTLPPSGVTFYTRATAVDVAAIPDYAAFRKNAVPYDPYPWYGLPMLPPMGTPGTARATSWYQFQ